MKNTKTKAIKSKRQRRLPPATCSAAAEYLYLVAAKKTAKHCKGLIPWERVNLATRTGFGRLARWVISQGIQLPPNDES